MNELFTDSFVLCRVWEMYKGEFDYLVKADDDTYLIVENLKHILNNYNSR